MISLPGLRDVFAVAACVFVLASGEARAWRQPASAPGSGDVARAEKILVKLRRLEEAAREDFRAYQAAFKKFYPALFGEVADLCEGDLKTDLTTAVFLHETAYAKRHTSGAAPVNCDDGLRDVYLKLCREGEGATRTRFLRAKARLHSAWAEAIVRHSREATDAATLAALSEMRAARAHDAEIAARAVGALKALGGQVNAYSSLHEFEEGGGVARVPFEQFSADLSDALGEVETALAQLPRGPLHRALRNARNAFREGASLWRKSSRAEQKTVSANSLAAPDPLKALGLPPGAVNYTVVCDWRKAARAVEEAEGMIGKLKGDVAYAAVGGK